MGPSAQFDPTAATCHPHHRLDLPPSPTPATPPPPRIWPVIRPHTPDHRSSIRHLSGAV